jgi:ubiquitin-protein ligase
MSSSTPTAQTRRLLKDLEFYHQNPLPFIQNLEYSIDKEGFNQLTGILLGPENSAYENGSFHFRIKFPLEYPFKPHEFFFLTRICHPNVQSETGAACHDELLSSWTPKISIIQILTKMYSLLSQPDYNKFYNDEKISGKDPDTARQWTQKYARTFSV